MSRVAILQLGSARGDDPGGRRRFVATFGDAVRQAGAVAIEGHGIAVGESGESLPPPLDLTGRDGAAATLGRTLLEALEEYFAVAVGSFSGLVDHGVVLPVAGAFRAPRGSTLTLAIWPLSCEVAVSVEGGVSQRLAAGRGQLLVLPGEVLVRSSNGVISRSEQRVVVEPAEASCWRVELRPAPAALIAPLPGFVSALRAARYAAVVASSLVSS